MPGAESWALPAVRENGLAVGSQAVMQQLKVRH